MRHLGLDSSPSKTPLMKASGLVVSMAGLVDGQSRLKLILEVEPGQINLVLVQLTPRLFGKNKVVVKAGGDGFPFISRAAFGIEPI